MDDFPVSKACTRCGVDKPLEEFTPQRTGKYGRLAYCRPCNAEYVRARSQDPEFKALKAEKQRSRRQDPAKAASDRVTSARWKAQNRERALTHNRTPEKLAYNIAWGKANRDKKLAATKRYQAKNPEISAVSRQRRRARLLNTGSTLTQAQWRAILEAFNHRCGYCLASGVPLQQEHMTPLSRGGAHDESNVIPACAACNYSKHTKTLLEFLAAG